MEMTQQEKNALSRIRYWRETEKALLPIKRGDHMLTHDQVEAAKTQHQFAKRELRKAADALPPEAQS